MLDAKKVTDALEMLQSAATIKCVCHRNPDGDAIGSLIGMGLLLEATYPDKSIELHCVDPAPETMHFLPSVHRMRADLTIEPDDVFIFLDSAEPKLTEYHEKFPALFDGSVKSICFDHHPSNPKYATINFIIPEAASTCEIVVDFADRADWKLTPDIATALLTGVYTDTGGLLHSNTSSGVYRTVARLLRAGARQQLIVKQVFRTAKLSSLKLWGRVLENINISEEGGAVAALRESDFRATGADYSELTGVIDYVNAVPGMRFSLILSERQGKVKGSLRTLRDDVDVSEMAQKFQGGGHKKAAGFALSGKLMQESRWKVVPDQGVSQDITLD